MTQNDMKVEPVDLIDLDKNSYLTNQTDRIESIDRFTATFLPLVGLFGLFCQGGIFGSSRHTGRLRWLVWSARKDVDNCHVCSVRFYRTDHVIVHRSSTDYIVKIVVYLERKEVKRNVILVSPFKIANSNTCSSCKKNNISCWWWVYWLGPKFRPDAAKKKKIEQENDFVVQSSERALVDPRGDPVCQCLSAGSSTPQPHQT